MTTIPASWQRLIDEAREHDPHAIIAGGAIRDLICGRKPKDIDIFMKETSKLLCGASGGVHLTGGWATTGDYSTTHCQIFEITGVYNRQVEGLSQEIQYIQLKRDIDPLPLIEEFDFGICMAAYDGKEIIRSRHFEEDYRDHIFTLRHCRDMEAAKRRWLRITKRYRDPAFGLIPSLSWFGSRWPMVLSGKARLDIMLQRLEAKGKLVPDKRFMDY